jgi:hypothetical protein
MRPLSKFIALLAFFVASGSLARNIEGLPGGDRLDLTMERPSHIEGVFSHEKVTVRFDSSRSANTALLVLKDERSRVIYSASAEGITYKIEFYGGKSTLRGKSSRSVQEPSPAPEMTGDKNLATTFAHSAEYKILPFLSRDLGAIEISGDKYPASLYLHGLALASAQENTIDAPDVEPGGKRAVERKSPCPDPAADPTKCNNDCFGMCGPGCHCWKRICGDCCMHAGCLTHDTTMRLCDCGALSHFSDCLKSWTALSFISTGGEGPPCMTVKGCKNPPKCD